MKKTIIALTGPSGVGKDFIAELIREVNMEPWQHLKFSKPMKDGLKLMLGLTEEQVTTDAKKEVITEFGYSPQQMLEKLGTDWGMDMISENIWSTVLKKRIDASLFNGIVISDLRGESQARFIREMGGIVVHVHSTESSQAVRRLGQQHKIHDPIMYHPNRDYMFKNDKNRHINEIRGDVMNMLNDIKVDAESGPPHEITPVESLQNQIAAWADEVFPNRTITNALNKLVMEEIPEYLTSQHDPMELADCAILIFDIAHLAGIDLEDCMQKKLEINKKRTWKIDTNTGLMNHVKENRKPFHANNIKVTIGGEPLIGAGNQSDWDRKEITERNYHEYPLNQGADYCICVALPGKPITYVDKVCTKCGKGMTHD